MTNGKVVYYDRTRGFVVKVNGDLSRETHRKSREIELDKICLGSLSKDVLFKRRSKGTKIFTVIGKKVYSFDFWINGKHKMKQGVGCVLQLKRFSPFR